MKSAGTYIYDYFAAQGFAPEYDTFSFAYQGTLWTTRNIVATIPGKTAPEQVVIVGAHYDSTSNQPLMLAPGADDDASGTAAVMEIARVMRDQPFDFSVRFICFSAEEIGLIGSRHYAQAAAAAGESIIGMIQLDMIAYASRTGEDLDVISNTTSAWLADLFLSAAGTYTALPAVKWIQPSAVGSDHSPFWDQGFSAILAIESYPLVNPYYHKPTDTIDTLDMDFETSVTKAALATAAVLAQPVGMMLVPANVTARAETIRSLFRRFKNVVLTWDANDATATGYNVYRSPVARVEFQKINDHGGAGHPLCRPIPSAGRGILLRHHGRGRSGARERLLEVGPAMTRKTALVFPRYRYLLHVVGGIPALRPNGRQSRRDFGGLLRRCGQAIGRGIPPDLWLNPVSCFRPGECSIVPGPACLRRIRVRLAERPSHAGRSRDCQRKRAFKIQDAHRESRRPLCRPGLEIDVARRRRRRLQLLSGEMGSSRRQHIGQQGWAARASRGRGSCFRPPLAGRQD